MEAGIKSRLAFLLITIGALAFMGCPTLPPGAPQGLYGEVHATGNIFLAWPQTATSGFMYTPIGGESTWLLTNTSDWQHVTVNGTSIWGNDSIPVDKVHWLFTGVSGCWSKTESHHDAVWQVTEEAVDHPLPWGYPGPNMQCRYANSGHAPFHQDSGNAYPYVVADIKRWHQLVYI